MNIINQIGIAVSGCKNGYALLAYSDNVDRNSPDIKQALRDQRSFMRINEPKHTFYTMSLLRDKLVISACKSSIDSVGSSGAYIAVSLLVPHTIQVAHGATLLSHLLEAYWSEYMHPMFGSPVPGKLENIHPLLNILNANAGEFSPAKLRYKITPSMQSQPPVYIGFNSLHDVDAAMSNPYHNQYSRGAEVIFLPQNLMSGGLVSFNTDMVQGVIQKSKPLAAINRLMVSTDTACKLSNYAVDGVIYPNPADISLSPQSHISYILTLPDGSRAQYQGTLENALHTNKIMHKGEDYVIVNPRIRVRLRLLGAYDEQPGTLILVGSQGRKAGARIVGTDLYEWDIMCAQFPYSLYLEKGRTSKLLQSDAITADSLGAAEKEIDLTPLLKPKTIQQSNSESALNPNATTLQAIKKLPRWLIAAISVVITLILALIIYIFFLKDSDDEPQTDTEAIIQEDTTVVKPDTTVISIPSMAVRECLQGKTFDKVETKDFPAEAIIEPFSKENGIVIKIPNNAKQKFAQYPEIKFVDKNGVQIATVPLETSTVADMTDLLLFPANNAREFKVNLNTAPGYESPADEQNELINEIREESITAPVPSTPPKPAKKPKPATPEKGKTSPSQKPGKQNKESKKPGTQTRSSEAGNAKSINF